jgi:hypothetical protein
MASASHKFSFPMIPDSRRSSASVSGRRLPREAVGSFARPSRVSHELQRLLSCGLCAVCAKVWNGQELGRKAIAAVHR